MSGNLINRWALTFALPPERKINRREIALVSTNVGNDSPHKSTKIFGLVGNFVAAYTNDSMNASC